MPGTITSQSALFFGIDVIQLILAINAINCHHYRALAAARVAASRRDHESE